MFRKRHLNILKSTKTKAYEELEKREDPICREPQLQDALTGATQAAVAMV